MFQVIKWLYNNSKGQHKYILLNCIIGVFGVFCILGFIYSSKKVIDIATGHIEGSFLLFSILMALCLLTEILLDIWSTWLKKNISVKLQNQLQKLFFSRLLLTEWSGIERHHSGDLLNRLVQDVKDIVALLSTSIPLLIVSCIQILAAFIFLFKLDNTLAAIVVVIMPLFLLVSKLYMKRMRELTHDIRKKDGRIQSVIQESLQHRVVIKTLEQSDTFIDRLGGLHSTLYKQVEKQTRFSIFSRLMIMLGFAGGYLSAFIWGAYHLSIGSITFGVMSAFLQLVGRIQRPTIDLSSLIPSFITGYTAAERLIELESLPLETKRESLLIKNQIGIHFENVSFAYKESNKIVFNNFTYDFPPGASIAILGETGVGKTSLIRLMLSLLKPGNGNIYLYDNKNNRYEVSALTRCNFVYVPQGNTLFSGTIRDNLLLCKPTVSDSELENVLSAAAADFVYNLPLGLDTICGEHGDGLSEGQSQRICIARALLRPGSILLLDEATSALDPETEEKLLERLRIYAADKTIIFITHRMAITKECNLILKLD